MEHVKVLRRMRNEWPLATDEGPALDAAIASLSAPQPPAEAQAVAWEWEYIGGDQYPRGHKVARSLREMDPTNPPYPETWRPTRPLIYGDTAPPSAPVGVEGLPERWRREASQAKVDSGEDAACAYREAVYAYREAVYWCAFQLEAALAQQPAAVDDTRRLEYLIDNELLVHRLSDTGLWMVTTGDLTPAIDGSEYDTWREAIDDALAAQQGGRDNG